jgi:ribokinase
VIADLVLSVDRLPHPGETLGASSLQFFPGGKGANQAAAAAKLGWPTYLVGQLGADSNADALEAALRAAGVDLQHVQRVEGPSGTAVILLQGSGGLPGQKWCNMQLLPARALS